jgi:hypothetical protein
VLGDDGDANTLQGEFGEQWLRVVASGCGLLHGNSDSRDLLKADVSLTLKGEHGDTYNPTIWAQVKTTHSLRLRPDGTFVYDLDVPTYNVLRRNNHMVRRVLVVLKVSADSEKVQLQEDGTLLVGEARWVSLEGGDVTANTDTLVVELPPGNTVDSDGLHKMLTSYGVRRSTPVPVEDPWESE